ncbi:protocatechuate 4,5-dioxygenase subunit alpha [Candidatus Poriferisodalis sp.]|uniref:protocatechuate 4,5-dioxygenase subunit alpha n=1 Tax=Candidatus Poriferisodalis sp. TaxID=3101277 RepID=UPI003B5A5BB6
MARARDYDDIPGTYVFDGRRSQQGYQLNMFCMSLNAEANRERFRADERAYLDGFDLTSQQRRAVLERDWLGMLQLGGNIYYTFKLAALDGLSMQDVGGAMSGVSGGEFNQMMIDGGRPVDGNRRTGEFPADQSPEPQSPEIRSTAGHSS